MSVVVFLCGLDGGESYYATLKDAVAAVPTTGEATNITMVADATVEAGVTIAAEKSVILELNGKTISGNNDSSTTYALITNMGTLVIQDNTDTQKDGTGDGLITTYITNPDQGDVPGYASNTITNNGNLTVKSGKIVNNGSGYACYAIDNQTNGNLYTPVVRIEGGRMQQMNAKTYAVRMFCNSTTKSNTVEVSGGVIEGGYGLWLQTPNAKENIASLTINGGVLNARDGGALYVGGTKANNSSISINITDGTINGTGALFQGPLSGTYGSISISGGDIQNVQCGANVEHFISGGTFHTALNETYIALGYEAVQSGNNSNLWTVVEAEAEPYAFEEGVVTVSSAEGFSYVSQNYADFRDANHNLAIKLDADIDISNVEFNSFAVNNYTSSDTEIVLFTFDGQGHTLKGLNKMLISSTWAGHSAVIVKDLTIDSANIAEDVDDTKQTVGVGAICGYSDSSQYIHIINVKLQNSTIAGGHWTGGFIGYATGYDNANDGPQFTNIKVTNCSVEATTVEGKGSVGALVAHAAGSAAMLWEVSNFVSRNNILTNTAGKTDRTGAVIGTIGDIASNSSAFPDNKNGLYFTSPLTVEGNSVNGAASNRKVGREGTTGAKVFLDEVLVNNSEWMQ